MSLDVAPAATETTGDRFWPAFQHAPLGMALVLPDGRFERANASLLQMLGYSEAELREVDIPSITHPADLPAERRLFRQALQDRDTDVFHTEKRFKRRDGSTFLASVTTTVERSKTGKPAYFLYMVTEQASTEGREVELYPRSNERHLLDAVASIIEDASVCTDQQGRITAWNPAARRLYGYTAEEVAGQPFSMLVHPDYLDEWAHLLTAAALGERVTGYEAAHVSRDGNTLQVSVSLSPIPTSTPGAPTEILTLCKDLAVERALSAELQESRGTPALLLEAVPAGVILTDPQGRPVFANSRARELLGPGITSDNAPLYPMRIRGTGEPYPSERAPLHRALKGQPGQCSDMEVSRPSGVVPLECQAQPVFDPDGNLIYALAVYQEIAALRATEGALAAAQSRYEAVCEHVDELVTVFDLQGRYVYSNQSSARLLGYRAEELMGTNMPIYVHPADMHVVSKSLSPYFAGSDEQMRATYRFRRRDGEYIWLETDARPISGTYGLKREVLCVSRPLEEVPDMLASLTEEKQRRGRRASDGERDARRDRLTGVVHRDALEEYVTKRLDSRRAATYPIGFLLIDVDGMTGINEAHGTEVGDEVLKSIALLLESGCRAEDFIGRVGSDQFLVVLPTTDAPGTVVVGERLVQAVRDLSWDGSALSQGVTISVGGTCVIRYSGLTAGGLMEVLESQLHEAKQAGRNRLIMNARRMARSRTDD